MNGEKEFSFFEFFAGGGMARAGLGSRWQCLFANDFDEKKATSYTLNWGDDHLVLADVSTITTNDLNGHADLAGGAGAGTRLRGECGGSGGALAAPGGGRGLSEGVWGPRAAGPCL